LISHLSGQGSDRWLAGWLPDGDHHTAQPAGPTRAQLTLNADAITTGLIKQVLFATWVHWAFLEALSFFVHPSSIARSFEECQPPKDVLWMYEK
jgi:hypothetical protein